MTPETLTVIVCVTMAYLTYHPDGYRLREMVADMLVKLADVINTKVDKLVHGEKR